MDLFGWLLAGAAAGHVMKPKNTVKVTLRIEEDVPDDGEEEYDSSLSTSAGGIYVHDNGVDPPRFFTKNGHEVDQNGEPL